MNRHRPHARALVALLLAILLVAACGTSEENDAGADPAPSDDAAADDTLRVVALEWMHAEALVTLGVMPVGVADVDGYTTWVGAAAPLDDTVADVGTRGEPSVDAIIDLEPDLILMEAGTDELATQMAQYAEVLVVQGSDASDNLGQLRSNLTTIAEAVDAEDAADTALAELDARLAEATDALEAAGVAGDGFAMADGWLDGSTVSIRMFAEGSLMSDLAEEIGLENRWPEAGDAMWGLGQTDVEGLTALDDVHFFYSASDPESDVFGGALADNPIWSNLPFVQTGQVHKLDAGTWTFGSVGSAMFFVDQIVNTLAP